MAEAFDLVAESRAARMVWSTLKIVFGIVPIVAGLDKFTNLLVQWEKYIAPIFASLLPFSGRTLMYIAGVIEIIAGVGVLATRRTRVFAGIVGIWLLGISVDLIAGRFYDIAVRDIVMAISAFCLARLSAVARDSAQPADKTALMSEVPSPRGDQIDFRYSTRSTRWASVNPRLSSFGSL
jgi:uncharacterized membrane protein YphA (DoxX/SURF4 family)